MSLVTLAFLESDKMIPDLHTTGYFLILGPPGGLGSLDPPPRQGGEWVQRTPICPVQPEFFFGKVKEMAGKLILVGVLEGPG